MRRLAARLAARVGQRWLSGVVIRGTGGCVAWVNANARHALTPELKRVVARL